MGNHSLDLDREGSRTQSDSGGPAYNAVLSESLFLSPLNWSLFRWLNRFSINHISAFVGFFWIIGCFCLLWVGLSSNFYKCNLTPSSHSLMRCLFSIIKVSLSSEWTSTIFVLDSGETLTSRSRSCFSTCKWSILHGSWCRSATTLQLIHDLQHRWYTTRSLIVLSIYWFFDVFLS